MPKKKSNNLIFILLSIIIIAVVLLIISIVKLFIKPTETTLVKNGELTKYEEVVGYIIRDETLIDTIHPWKYCQIDRIEVGKGAQERAMEYIKNYYG